MLSAIGTVGQDEGSDIEQDVGSDIEQDEGSDIEQDEGVISNRMRIVIYSKTG
jgi:hypothetical protein